MKKIALLLLCTPVILLGAPLPSGTVNGRVRLSWSYPTNEIDPGNRFNFYATTNLATPFAQWTFLTSTPGTNLSIDLDLVPDRYFIVANCSNMWGETSITSNVVVTPLPPRPINDSLKIQKLP